MNELIKNMKMKKKLLVSFILVVLVASCSGVFGLGMLFRSDISYSNALEENGFVLGDIGDFNAYMNKAATLLRDVIIATNDTERSKAENELQNDVAAKIDSTLKLVKVNCKTEQEVVYLNAIESDLSKYREYRNQVISLAEQGKDDEALSVLTTSAEPLMDVILENTDSLMAYNQELGQKVSSSLTIQSYISMAAILVVIVLAVIVSMWFAMVLANSISERLIVVQQASAKMAQGDLNIELKNEAKDEIGELTETFAETVTELKKYIGEIARILDEISHGNMNVTNTVNFRGEFVHVSNSIDLIITSLSDTFGQIIASSDQIASGSDQVSIGSQALSQGAAEQASAIEELAATIDDVSHQIHTAAEHADNAKEKNIASHEELLDCGKQMKDLVHAMDVINNKAGEINKIIKTIEDIAFQTNILALNAAVEAARAGSAGKGFAVVADEVRNLAAKSADAAKDTTTLIEETIKAVQDGNKISVDTEDSLNTALAGAEEVLTLVANISEAANKQAEAVQQITQGIDQISSVVQTNAATAEESAASSEELSGQAQLLKTLMSQFTILGDNGSANKVASKPISAPVSKPVVKKPSTKAFKPAKAKKVSFNEGFDDKY